jgi:murein L,D-transpeptidase YafK
MKYFCFILLFFSMQNGFKNSQLQHSRVKNAYDEKELTVKKYFVEKKLNYTGFNLFLRAFKKEKELQVWVKESDNDQYVHLHTYNFCNTSGVLGPKRKEGDFQIPEGMYKINHFNPLSNFHLSLGIDYPNASDRILSNKQTPGGSIYIHGNCVTVGCIPITDEMIKELYVLAVEAKNNGQQNIPVHIFPTRLDAASMETLIQKSNGDFGTINFWKNLQNIYNDFEASNRIRSVHVNKKGEYYF